MKKRTGELVFGNRIGTDTSRGNGADDETARRDFKVAVGSFCASFDPPDLVDFKLRAAPPLLEIPFTPAPGFPSELNEAIGTLIDTMSLLVQAGKGMQQSADRFAGARLVGTPTDIAHQTAWLGHSGRWEQAAWRQLLRRSQTTLNCSRWRRRSCTTLNYLWLFLKATRDDEAAGFFQHHEQLIVDPWQLSPAQERMYERYVGGLSDAKLDGIGPITFGAALNQVAVGCQSCVPEPSSVVLWGSGLILLLLAPMIQARFRRA